MIDFDDDLDFGESFAEEITAVASRASLLAVKRPCPDPVPCSAPSLKLARPEETGLSCTPDSLTVSQLFGISRPPQSSTVQTQQPFLDDVVATQTQPSFPDDVADADLLDIAQCRDSSPLQRSPTAATEPDWSCSAARPSSATPVSRAGRSVEVPTRTAPTATTFSSVGSESNAVQVVRTSEFAGAVKIVPSLSGGVDAHSDCVPGATGGDFFSRRRSSLPCAGPPLITSHGSATGSERRVLPLDTSCYSSDRRRRSTGAVKRRFPGPAGVLPVTGSLLVLAHEVSLHEENDCVDDLDDLPTDTPSQCNFTQTQDALTECAVWRRMTSEFDVTTGGVTSLLGRINISAVKRAAANYKLRKVPFLAVALRSLEPVSDLSYQATFKDSTGVMDGTISKSAVQMSGAALRPGCVLVVQDAAVWRASAHSLYLSVTHRSLAYVFSPDRSTDDPDAVVVTKLTSSSREQLLSSRLTEELSPVAVLEEETSLPPPPRPQLFSASTPGHRPFSRRGRGGGLRPPVDRRSSPASRLISPQTIAKRAGIAKAPGMRLQFRPSAPGGVAAATPIGPSVSSAPSISHQQLSNCDLDAIFADEDESIFGGLL